MRQTLTIKHELADIVVSVNNDINETLLKNIIYDALEQYQQKANIPASHIHEIAEASYGEDYRTPGYFLKMYRLRADMTQIEIAEKTGLRQHHLSEMENNKRPIGKVTAKKLAQFLNCDYRKFL